MILFNIKLRTYKIRIKRHLSAVATALLIRNVETKKFRSRLAREKGVCL